MSDPRPNEASTGEASPAGQPPKPAEPRFKAVFTEGSTMRHVVTMTATGSIGLIAIFVVDLLNLFYISLLGQQELAAAIGYAGTLLFFVTSIGIGLSIAATALVSRALGAGRRAHARRIATVGLILSAVSTGIIGIGLLPALGKAISAIGATGAAHELACRFLMIVMPSSFLLGIGMTASGILRAVGDARRAMWVTLGGGIITALLDPLLIFGLGLGLDGAALTMIASRTTLALVGLNGVVRIHNLAAPPSLADLRSETGPLAAIALPAILTNLATPVANAFVTAGIARFGDAAVAAWAVAGRLLPVVFGAVFALSGSVGPILGQNLGAGLHARVRRALTDSLTLTVVYCLGAWLVLALLAQPIAHVFGLTDQAAELLIFFCRWVAGTFLFTGTLFVANAAFNNLGFATYSMLFNWGRATLGTIPFVTFGAAHFGAEGVMAGQGLGSVAFGILAVFVAYRAVGRIAAKALPAG